MDPYAWLAQQRIMAMLARAPVVPTPPPVTPMAYGSPASYPLAASYGAPMPVAGPPQAQGFALPAGPPADDWRTTGVFPGGGFDANAINASDPAARQNARHILTDYAGENRENPNNQAESQALAEQNQQQTGYYGYGSL